MNDAIQPCEGGVTAPQGFRASGVCAGIKPGSTKLDCALILSDRPAAVAGTFTTNVMKSPPVDWDVQVCARGRAQAVFINSGNANACTGIRGHEDTAATAAFVGEQLSLEPELVCISSTGVIGVPLPMDRIRAGVTGCVEALSRAGGIDAAKAIMTTDTVPKERAVEVRLSTGPVRIGAMAKGSGMIAPNMATMIAIFTTDASIENDLLGDLTRRAVEVSFNCICVDNDMSTSDTVLCLANGLAGGAPTVAGSEDCALFAEALTVLHREMARMLVKDGEGAKKFVEIAVAGAPSHGEAKTIARAIAQSQLCKTAFFGEDPNWGRFACAAGYAGVPFAPEAFSLWLDDIRLVADGLPAEYREVDAAAVMKRPEYRIRVQVGNGLGEAVFWTTDLGHDYVAINADYRT